MDDYQTLAVKPARQPPWNKGKRFGAKPPLRPSHVWSIRTKLQMRGLTRDLALFNLAIDSKLRGCDVRRRPCRRCVESTVRYLGIEVDDAIEIAEKIDI